MAQVVVPSNLGNSLDIGVIEPSKIHVNADGVSIVRNILTGELSAFSFFAGPATPPPPAADEPTVAIDTTTGGLYFWDGASWISASDTNFANADLTFTGPRSHIGSGFPLSISGLSDLEIISQSSGSRIARLDAGNMVAGFPFNGAGATVNDTAAGVIGFSVTGENSGGDYASAIGVQNTGSGANAQVFSSLDPAAASPSINMTASDNVVGAAGAQAQPGVLYLYSSNNASTNTQTNHDSTVPGAPTIYSAVNDGINPAHVFTQDMTQLTSTAYPNTRDDSTLSPPINFLYTDPAGNFRSAPFPSIQAADIPAPIVRLTHGLVGVGTDKGGNPLTCEGTVVVAPGEINPALLDPSLSPQIELLRWRKSRSRKRTGEPTAKIGAGWVHPSHWVGNAIAPHTNGTRGGGHNLSGIDRPTEWSISGFTAFQYTQIPVYQLLAPWFYQQLVQDWMGNTVTTLFHSNSGSSFIPASQTRGIPSNAYRAAFAFRISIIDPATGFRVSGPPSAVLYGRPKRMPFVNQTFAGNPQRYRVNPAVSGDYSVLIAQLGEKAYR